jgi:hypothetical protein
MDSFLRIDLAAGIWRFLSSLFWEGQCCGTGEIGEFPSGIFGRFALTQARRVDGPSFPSFSAHNTVASRASSSWDSAAPFALFPLLFLLPTVRSSSIQCEARAVALRSRCAHPDVNKSRSDVVLSRLKKKK